MASSEEKAVLVSGLYSLIISSGIGLNLPVVVSIKTHLEVPIITNSLS